MRWTRTLRNRLTATLVGVALVSVLLIGLLNAYAARQLLDSGARDRLTSIAQARARGIEVGADRLRAQFSMTAADPTIAAALEDLIAAHRDLSEELDRRQGEELEDWYRTQVVEPIEAAGLGPAPLDELRPATSTGRYLQYHYIISRPEGTEGRELLDAGDGSAYSAAHAVHHPYLVTVAAGLGGGDLLLVSADDEVVYSVDKRIELGTDFESGPYRDSRLAVALRDQLSRTSAGQTVLVDVELYLPARGAPTLFLIAAVRRGTAVIGAIAVEVPAATLSAIATAGGNWDAVGLPEGESYVVGSDLVLRSESRLWIEDPDEYLERTEDEELARLIRTFGSPVGLQPVDTEGVRSALDGTSFDGQTRNFLGQSTFTSVVPIDVEGVDWVAVVDTPLSEARSGLYVYAIRLGLVLLVLLPLAGLIGFLMADRLARPIPPVSRAAEEVAAGERDPDLGALGGDEIGDLGRRLLQTTSELAREEEELAAEFERKRSLLLSVLPPRLVSDRGDVNEEAVEAIETTTAIAVGVVATADDGAEPDADARVLTAVGDLAAALAAEHGVERVRSSADRHLLLAGVGAEGPGAEDALAFSVALVAGARPLADSENIALGIHVGLSTGPVATGVLDTGYLTYGAWGEPIRRALAIAALASIDEILVDGSTASAADGAAVELVAATDVVSLDGEPMGLLAVGTSPDR